MKVHKVKSIQSMSILLLLAVVLTACQEEVSDVNVDIADHEQGQAAGSNTNDNADPIDERQAGEDVSEYAAGTQAEAAGTSGSGDQQDHAPGLEDSNMTDSDLDEESESTSQTWQEDEAAQRQATVDVGGGNSLILHSQNVITKVEGHRARTIVDQIFYSPYDRELEGTFRYSLPVGASVSHYALYLGRISGDLDALGNRNNEEPLAQLDGRSRAELSADELLSQIAEDSEAWGDLRVGRIVSQADGREAFEDTTRQNIDPALVESVTPNSFQARVFPIQSRGYTRIVFAYDEALDRVGNELVYTFPLPDEEIAHLSFHLHVDNEASEEEITLDAPLPLTSLPARPAGNQDENEMESAPTEQEGRAWSGLVEGMGPGGAVTLRLPAQLGLEVVSGFDRDIQAFAGRLTIDGISGLGANEQSTNDRAIFVLDTSLSSQPTRFGINRQLLAEILTQNSEIEEFAVLSFDLGAEWLTDGFVQNTAEQRAMILSQVDQILLEGATRFSAVTDALAAASWIGENTDLFLLSDGAINWGMIASEQLALQLSRIERVFAYKTGVGAENLNLYRQLTKKGGVFSCLTMESIPTCATAHRSPSLQLVDLRIDGIGNQPAVTNEVVFSHHNGDVFDGAEIRFAGKIELNGQAELRLTLSNGQTTHEMTYPLELNRQEDNILAPRAWAELLVSLLSTTGRSELQELIHALAQRYTILTKEVVLLVLESDEEYEVYNLPSIWEDTLANVESIIDHLEQAVSAGTIFLPLIEYTLNAIDPQIQDATGQTLEDILTLLDLDLYELSLPDVAYQHATQSGRDYTNGSTTAADYGIYMDEAERRFANGLTSAAARALSTIVENDSSNAVALRLVAYRLHTWGFTGLSAELFTEVLRRRPYEPQSYRDLAYVVREEKPALAAILYDIASQGNWDRRFQQMNVLISEEYSLFIRQLTRQNHPLAPRLQRRAAELNLPNNTEDLRVILSWNTDNVDIDLWVTSPDGFKCYYASPESPTGGLLLDDIVQGFGPERFSQANADSGEYFIQAHYYSNNGSRLEAETFVHVTVIKYAGTEREEVVEYDALLADTDQVADIARIQF